MEYINTIKRSTRYVYKKAAYVGKLTASTLKKVWFFLLPKTGQILLLFAVLLSVWLTMSYRSNNRKLIDNEATIKNINEQIQLQKAIIKDLEDANAGKQRALKLKDGSIKDKQDAIEDLNSKLESSNNEVKRLESELQAKKIKQQDAKTQLAVNQEKSQPIAQAPVSSGSCELVYNYSNWDVNVAKAVCLAESGGNTNAVNLNDWHGTCRGSYGLFQLGCFWISNPTDPVANVAKANAIYVSSGWQPWGAYTSGAFRNYL